MWNFLINLIQLDSKKFFPSKDSKDFFFPSDNKHHCYVCSRELVINYIKVKKKKQTWYLEMPIIDKVTIRICANSWMSRRYQYRRITDKELIFRSLFIINNINKREFSELWKYDINIFRNSKITIIFNHKTVFQKF